MRLCVFRASSVFAKQKEVATQATGGGVLGERGRVRAGGGGGEVRERVRLPFFHRAQTA
jgi:hypothetical protein